ncbi:NADH dehydrogenase [ubiquinone] 1 alpha subcomplex subunit 7 [Pseudolycoriella hygida]|uniref:NADH dehydrogenase [ubiquinone] 1 alpha subcomplex subunit 7 n=1 Tax=Pseudolycoriella hygida TaxID=35572 RepID=A0A9Q0S554_9DIPT|nr:NADH dehydrogenase [ubiquinone] 1 alpha subcomplex subunit 7 [Pseudolycoriella hygida]KAJ6645832.1 NADH dehydrogenase [ubiquinone] 1 alpha subcomplex subunit 7 [Pseudolycoriella hygida]
MSGPARRDVSHLLQRIRAFLLGRELTNSLRFEYDVADRTTNPPELPDGPAHKLSANYYVNRDGRREVAPPQVLSKSTLIASGESAQKVPTPGAAFRWD